MLNSAIHWINHYPLDNSIGFASVYPLDSDLSGGQRYPSFEQLGPGLEMNWPRECNDLQHIQKACYFLYLSLKGKKGGM